MGCNIQKERYVLSIYLIKTPDNGKWVKIGNNLLNIVIKASAEEINSSVVKLVTVATSFQTFPPGKAASPATGLLKSVLTIPCRLERLQVPGCPGSETCSWGLKAR